MQVSIFVAHTFSIFTVLPFRNLPVSTMNATEGPLPLHELSGVEQWKLFEELMRQDERYTPCELQST